MLGDDVTKERAAVARLSLGMIDLSEALLIHSYTRAFAVERDLIDLWEAALLAGGYEMAVEHRGVIWAAAYNCSDQLAGREKTAFYGRLLPAARVGGIEHYMQAYVEGVPVEDILA